MNKKTYCDYCDDFIEFNIKENQVLYDEIFDVNYLGTTCFCKRCSNKVNPDDIEILNMKKANDEYERKIIKPEDIKNLLEKYSIEANNLSNILEWEEDTITRYINGSKPSIKNSNILKILYENSNEIVNLMKK